MQIELLLKHIDLTTFAVYTIDNMHTMPFDKWCRVGQIHIYRTKLNRYKTPLIESSLAKAGDIKSCVRSYGDQVWAPYWIVNFEKTLIIRSEDQNIKPI